MSTSETKAIMCYSLKALNFTQGCSALFLTIICSSSSHSISSWLAFKHHRHGNYNHSCSHPMTWHNGGTRHEKTSSSLVRTTVILLELETTSRKSQDSLRYAARFALILMVWRLTNWIHCGFHLHVVWNRFIIEFIWLWNEKA